MSSLDVVLLNVSFYLNIKISVGAPNLLKPNLQAKKPQYKKITPKNKYLPKDK